MTDRKVTLSVQRDGNRNKIVTREGGLGALGQYDARVRFNRFGQGRAFDMTIRVTSPIPSHLMGAVADVET